MANPTTDAATDNRIARLYRSGMSQDAVARRAGVSRMIVARVLREQGITTRTPRERRPYSVRSDAFNDLSGEQAAYWLGFVFADGSLQRGTLSVTLSARDGAHLSRLAAFIGGSVKASIYSGYKVARLSVSDAELASRLRSLGIEPFRPRGLMLLRAIPRSSLHHFLRGWFDGDGSALAKPQLAFIARLDFILRVGALLKREVGAPIVTVKGPRRGYGSLVYRGIYRCNDIVDYLYRDATIWLPRKRQRIQRWPRSNRKRAERFCASCGHRLP